MDYLVQRKSQSEDLNKKIKNILVARSRNRNGPSTQQIDDNGDTKLQELLNQAKQLNLQSESITKLEDKVSQINEWKSSVLNTFKNRKQESDDFKLYLKQYKRFITNSQAFHIELSLSHILQRKCMLIEWREKVEEIAKKVQDHRISFE